MVKQIPYLDSIRLNARELEELLEGKIIKVRVHRLGHIKISNIPITWVKDVRLDREGSAILWLRKPMLWSRVSSPSPIVEHVYMEAEELAKLNAGEKASGWLFLQEGKRYIKFRSIPLSWIVGWNGNDEEGGRSPYFQNPEL